jgi:hypothetical protein
MWLIDYLAFSLHGFGYLLLALLLLIAYSLLSSTVAR